MHRVLQESVGILWRRLNRARRRCRGWLFASRLRSMGARVGHGIEIEGRVVLRHPAHSGLAIGRGCSFGHGVILDVPAGGTLTIGDLVKVMHGCVLAAELSVTIGSQSQFGEYSSVRDGDHGMVTSGVPMRDQPSTTAPIVIGGDVWVGRGCAVLKGVSIGDGAVIGSNSVVTRSIPSQSVAFGSPARVFRSRLSTGEAGSI